MRVLIAAESYEPADNDIVAAVRQTAHLLGQRGHHVTILAPTPGPTVSLGDVVVHRVDSLALTPKLRVGFPPFHAIDRVLDQVDPDVVHLACPMILGRQVADRCTTRGQPLVASTHDDLIRAIRRQKMPWAQAAAWAWLRKLHNKAELTLVPTTRAADELGRRGFERVRVWRRGVDVMQYHPSNRSDALRRTWWQATGACRPSPEPAIVVGVVGSLSSESSIGHLVRFDADPSIQLVLIGEALERPALLRRLPNSCFSAKVAGETVGTVLASLDVLISLDQSEGVRQTVLEAMASGVAVLAPIEDGPGDLVEDNRNGFEFDESRTDDLAECVGELLHRPELLQRFGMAARALACERRLEVAGDQIADYFCSALTTPA